MNRTIKFLPDCLFNQDDDGFYFERFSIPDPLKPAVREKSKENYLSDTEAMAAYNNGEVDFA